MSSPFSSETLTAPALTAELHSSSSPLCGAKMTAEANAEEQVAAVVDEPENLAADEDSKVEESEPATIQKCSSFVEERGFISDLKEHEKKALLDLRAKIEDAIANNTVFAKKEKKEKKQKGEKNHEEEEKEEEEPQKTSDVEDSGVSLWGVPLQPSKGSEKTDVILLKFLRAREFKVKESFEMLKDTLQWRKEARIDSILEESLGEGLEEAAYMNGFGREGHPVCYNIYGIFHDAAKYDKAFGAEENVEKFLRWRFQILEKGIQKLDFRPGGVSSILQISDLKNSPGIYRKELRNTMQRALGLLQDNYPEFVAKNIIINAPFWYYALNALISPFMTQRTKNKFLVVRPSKVTETLLKYIPPESIPVRYGGLHRENDDEFSNADNSGVSEIAIKAGSIESFEIPVPEAGSSVVWDLAVVGWDVNYKEEFVPSDEGSYTILLQKGRKLEAGEEAVRNSFKSSEPGKVVLIFENPSSRKKKALVRYKVKSL